MSQPKRRYFRRGVYVAGALLVCLALVCVANLGLAYDGQCGGYFPGVSTSRPCSFSAYLTGDAFAIALILGLAFWPLIVAIAALPPLIGYVLDRRAERTAS